MVEETPGNWTNAREFYTTLSLGLKLTVNQTYNRTSGEKVGKLLIMTPQVLELSMLKIFKDKEE